LCCTRHQSSRTAAGFGPNDRERWKARGSDNLTECHGRQGNSPLNSKRPPGLPRERDKIQKGTDWFFRTVLPLIPGFLSLRFGGPLPEWRDDRCERDGAQAAKRRRRRCESSSRSCGDEMDPLPPQPFGPMGVAADLVVARRRRGDGIDSPPLRDLVAQASSAIATLFRKRTSEMPAIGGGCGGVAHTRSAHQVREPVCPFCLCPFYSHVWLVSFWCVSSADSGILKGTEKGQREWFPRERREGDRVVSSEGFPSD
jgi:hypothetical protein